MKKTIAILAVTGLVTSAQARHGADDGVGGGHHHNMAGCEVKLNGAFQLHQAFGMGSGIAENNMYRLSVTGGAGQPFTATLLDKQSNDVLQLGTESSGVLTAKLTTDENPAAPLILQLTTMGERYGNSSSGDSVKLERKVRGAFQKGEAYLRTNEAASNTTKLECQF